MTPEHVACLRPLRLTKRTVVSQPEDESWPKDFVMPVWFCDTCRVIPPIEDIKKEADET